MDLACLRDDTAHQLGFDRNAASCLRQRATGRRRALFSATRRRRSPREVPLHSSDCSGRLFRIPWLLASAALRQRGRWRRPWQGAGPCRTWRGASALVACGARAASPRGPRLDVLWSSLPKRERVLLRRYRRKVRSDRGDCQIGPLRRRSCMTEVKHYKVETNGIRMHVAEKGRGPLVVLCHGFPESWYSWRHQLRALADAGFRAVAPDITLSGDGPDGAHDTVPRGKGFLSRLTNPSALPSWVSEADVDFYAGESKRTGFILPECRCELGASRALRWCAG